MHDNYCKLYLVALKCWSFSSCCSYSVFWVLDIKEETFLVNVINKGNGAELWEGPNISLEECTPAKNTWKKINKKVSPFFRHLSEQYFWEKVHNLEKLLWQSCVSFKWGNKIIYLILQQIFQNPKAFSCFLLLAESFLSTYNKCLTDFVVRICHQFMYF